MASKMEIDDKLNSSLDTLVKQSGDRPTRGGGSGRGRGRGEKRERNENGELWRLIVDDFLSQELHFPLHLLKACATSSEYHFGHILIKVDVLQHMKFYSCRWRDPGCKAHIC